MGVGSSLESDYLVGGFNWLFLIESLTVGIVIIFYIFYFNRVLAWFIAALCNVYLRKYNFNASVKFEAIQLAPLAGRILFKNARYHSINQSLRIVTGHITCRYWYLRTQGMDTYHESTAGEPSSNSATSLPHRWIVEFEGAEWFVYNRTAAFDAILEQLGLSHSQDSSHTSLAKQQPTSDLIDKQSRRDGGASQVTFKIQPTTQADFTRSQNINQIRKETESSLMGWALRDALPVKIEGKTGVITIGNRSTPSILIIAFQKANGVYSAPNARSRHDFFKQDFKFSFYQLKTVLRTNPDFSRTLHEHGKKVLNELRADPTYQSIFRRPIYPILNSASFNQFRRYFGTKSSGLFDFLPSVHSRTGIPTTTDESQQFLGLPRFVQTETPIHPIEYAKATTILVASQVDFRYYLDSAGKVPADPLTVHYHSTALLADHEDGLPPEYGVDIKLFNANLTYGPWADRQRAVIHKAFFPAQQFNLSEASEPSGPGQKRAHTELKVKIEIANSRLRVPIREASKDWQWIAGLDSESNESPSTRLYGWLDLSFGSHSEILLTQGQIAKKDGYAMAMQVQIMDLEASCSVNDKVFAKIPMLLITADMPTPLIWDSPRIWQFKFTLSEKAYLPVGDVSLRSKRPQISLLRDHVQFLSDLVKDWTSGSPTPCEEWVPTTYKLEASLVDYNLCLHLNDLNIIENFDLASGSGSNTLLLLSGPSLKLAAIIPGDHYQPPVSSISFDAQFTKLNVEIDYPTWSPQYSFATESAANCAKLDKVTLRGKYDVNDQVKSNAVDCLSLTLELDGIIFKAFGHLFRLMINIKENYFGSYNHFRTQEEYIKALEKGTIGDVLEEVTYRDENSNMFEMNLTAVITNLLLAFPQDPFDCQEVVFCAVPNSSCSLRNHTSFMEINLQASPLKFQPVIDWEPFLQNEPIRRRILSGDFSVFPFQTQVRLERLQLKALRLFGPRPLAITYVGDWRLKLGKLTGQVAAEDMRAFANFFDSLAEGFTDKENALLADLPLNPNPDATFARLTSERVDLILLTSRCRTRLHLPSGLHVFFHDLCSDSFKSYLEIIIPLFGLYIMVPDSRADFNAPSVPWLEVASCTGNVEAEVLFAPLFWEKHARSQRAFLEEQDYITRNCYFLYGGYKGTVVAASHEFPQLASDILSGAERSDFHDPYAIPNLSDDEESLHSNSLNARGSDSSGEQSETDGRVAAKNLRRERLRYQRRLSASVPSMPRADIFPISTSSYATALPSWRYYGFNPNVITEEPMFLPMRAGLFPPECISEKQTSAKFASIPPRHFNGGQKTINSSAQVIGRHYFNLQMKTPFDLFLTPLCSEVIADMLEDIESGQNSDDEGPLFLNRLLRGLKANPSSNPPQEALAQIVFEFFAFVPLIRFRLLQDISPMLSPPLLSSTCNCTPLLSAITLTIQSIHLEGSSPQLLTIGPIDSLGLPRTVYSSFDGFCCLLRQDPRSGPSTMGSNITPNSNIPTDVVMAMDSKFAQFQLFHNGYRLESIATTSSSSFFFFSKAAETLAGSLASLSHHYRRGRRLISTFQNHRFERLQHAIHYLVKSNDGSSPSCLRHSPFWTHMSSRSRRSSFAWYCLLRLRNAIFTIGEDDAISQQAKPFDNEIREKLIAWNMDHGGDSDIGSLGVYLPCVRSASPPALYSKPLYLYFQENHSLLLSFGCFVARLMRNFDLPSFTTETSSLSNFLQVPPTTLLLATRREAENIQLAVHLKTGALQSRIDPHLTSLAQHIMSVVDTFNPSVAVSSSTKRTSDPRAQSATTDFTTFGLNFFSSIDCSVDLGGWKLQAMADGLGIIFECGTCCFNFGSKDLTKLLYTWSSAFTCSVSVERMGIYFREIHPRKQPLLTHNSVSEDLLMSGSIVKLGFNAFSQEESIEAAFNKVLILVSILSTNLCVGRSLVKVEEFIRDWRRQEVASRIAPIYHGIREAWKGQPTEKGTSKAKWTLPLSVEFKLVALNANFQPIPRLEVVYALQGLNAINIDVILEGGKLAKLTGGASLEQHSLSFTSSTEQTATPTSASEFPQHGLLKLPSLRLIFSSLRDHFNGSSTHIDLKIGFLSAYLSIDWLDTILTMGARYGKDINELVNLLRVPIYKRAESSVTLQPEPSTPFFADVVLDGFEFSVVAPKPMPQIECRLMKCTVYPKFRYVELHDCAISLLPRESLLGNVKSFAKFVFDFSLSNRSPDWACFSPNEPRLFSEDVVEVTADFQRIHAVAATSAFKLLLDCAQYLQKELLHIKTVRRAEMLEAQSCIGQALNRTHISSTSNQPMLQKLIFSGRCTQFGLAVPLDDDNHDKQVAETSGNDFSAKHESTQAALLISFTNLMTWCRLGQAAHASVDLFAIQAVSELNPSFNEHFESASHATRNAVFVPHLDVQFGLTARPQAPTLFAVKASAPSGITIDISPTIVLIICTFLDVYERDYHIVLGFLEIQQQASGFGLTNQSHIDLSPTIVDPWAIRVDFDTGRGGGGKIQLHTFDLPQDDVTFVESLKRANASLGRLNVDVAHSDLFFLPGVSAWALYNPCSTALDATLHIDILVHSSQNTVNPTLLRFASQMSTAVNQRAHRTVKMGGSTAYKPNFIKPTNPSAGCKKSSILSTNMSFGLRIDQSELSITCLPIPPLAKIQWASGVLFASGRPDQNRFNAACTITKISAFLRHEHGFDSALKAEAGDMVASLDLQASGRANQKHTQVCSAVVKFSELSTEVDFSHLNICLLFKAIWLDQVFPIQAEQKPDNEKSRSTDPKPKSRDTHIVLVAVTTNKVRLTLKLSPQVGAVHLVTTPLSLRMRHIPRISRSLSFDVGNTSAIADGDGLLGGRCNLGYFVLLINVEDLSSDTILDIKATLGPIEAHLAISSETVLLLRTNLIEGSVQDNWKAIKSHVADSPTTTDAERRLTLCTSLNLRSVDILATLYTTTRVNSVGDAIQSLLRQQSGQAEDLLKQLPIGMIVRRQKDTVLSVAQRLEREVSSEIICGAQQIRIFGSLTLTSQNISLALFAGQFGNMPLLKMRLGPTKVLLTRTPGATNLLHNLNFNTDGCHVVRLNLPPNGLSEKDQVDGTWYEVLKSASSESVLNANRLWISMLTSKSIDKSEIMHTFRAEMPNSIHISTDVTTHASLWSKFRSAWNKANDSKGGPSTTTIAAEDQDNTIRNQGLILIPETKPIIEDAKVKELWHATLPLVNYFKWNENLPKYTFNVIIKPLDQVIDFFESFYDSAFDYHQFK
ncbi:hypothetical protein O181_012758 [Austropuccinia psidii MF-1]|uniref:Csf1 N-terminal domain-containing protein n=1 Tax=Austropuccinia psidii MF-1 TaxID=1389203 RepID=A0A9Q3BXD1_9BASI|nr:hypothetical protein [Austropuccinia psidii MF-1]